MTNVITAILNNIFPSWPKKENTMKESDDYVVLKLNIPGSEWK